MYFRTWEKKKQGKSKTLAKLPRNQVSQRTMKFKCSMQATARQFNNKSNINRKACQFLWYSVCSLFSIYQSVQDRLCFTTSSNVEQKHREIDLICLDLVLLCNQLYGWRFEEIVRQSNLWYAFPNIFSIRLLKFFCFLFLQTRSKFLHKITYII